MSASMSKTFMSPDFLTKFSEEYRELPVLWQVRRADYSNRAVFLNLFKPKDQ
jgi:hypothetical protein